LFWAAPPRRRDPPLRAKQTYGRQQTASLFDHLIGARHQRFERIEPRRIVDARQQWRPEAQGSSKDSISRPRPG
jgi:hypothetical protein